MGTLWGSVCVGQTIAAAWDGLRLAGKGLAVEGSIYHIYHSPIQGAYIRRLLAVGHIIRSPCGTLKRAASLSDGPQVCKEVRGLVRECCRQNGRQRGIALCPHIDICHEAAARPLGVAAGPLHRFHLPRLRERSQISTCMYSLPIILLMSLGGTEPKPGRPGTSNSWTCLSGPAVASQLTLVARDGQVSAGVVEVPQLPPGAREKVGRTGGGPGRKQRSDWACTHGGRGWQLLLHVTEPCTPPSCSHTEALDAHVMWRLVLA